MNIYDLLKKSNVRVSCGDCWLIYDIDDGWTVMQRKFYKKKVKILINTQNEKDAIEVFVRGLDE